MLPQSSMTLSADFRQRAKELVDRLPASSLQQAIVFLEALQHQSETAPTTNASEQASEAQLLRIIQRQLSTTERTRLNYLRQCNEAETITPEEYQELLSYVARIEQQDAERAAALIQLSQLRQVELDIVLAEFLPSHAA